MTWHVSLEQVRLYLAASEDDAALQLISKLLDQQSGPLRHERLLLSSRLAGIRTRTRQGLLASEAEQTELLRWRAAALDFVDIIERRLGDTALAPAARELSILFVAANPLDTNPLRLDSELRLLQQSIERSRHRSKLKLEIRTAATIHDLCRALLDINPDLVHISCHGRETGLVLMDDHGECVVVPQTALARLFADFTPPAGRLCCVVLNACWSLSTGEAMTNSIPFVVAMTGPISDLAALEFTHGFYDALGAGQDFRRAYQQGKIRVELTAPDSGFESALLQSRP